ncbi:MAG TPA: SRPBCC family protein [Gemmataceae bacterium]|nr:SRPBCC family protein [Gemmataceae bacterium]
MEKPKFVYVTYIATTPEKLWNALVDGEMTRQYWWRHRNVSDWKVGSKWEHQDYDDASVVDIVGKVVECVPPRRLVLTWAFPADATNPAKHTRVTFEIEAQPDCVRLTVTHDELEPGSEMQRRISAGWPAVLSSLKTFLETGRTFASMSRRKTAPPG